MRKVAERIDESFAEFDAALMDLDEHDEDNGASDTDSPTVWAATAAAASSKKASVLDRLLRHIEAVAANLETRRRRNTAHRAPPAPAAGEVAQGPSGRPQGQAPKANTALRPDKLTNELQPAELRTWLHQLEAYFSSSHFHLLPVPLQHSYVFSCVEGALCTELRHAVEPEMPVFGESDSVVACIEAIFLRQNPLFRRRLDFFDLAISAAESPMQFIARVENVAASAGLGKVVLADLIKFQVVRGFASRPALTRTREDLHKQPDASLSEWKATVSANMSVASNEQAAASRAPQSKVAAVQPDGRGAASCDRCGKPRHPQGTPCPAAANRCSHCGITGHWQAVCRKRLAGLPPSSGRRQPARPRGSGGRGRGSPRGGARPAPVRAVSDEQQAAADDEHSE